MGAASLCFSSHAALELTASFTYPLAFKILLLSARSVNGKTTAIYDLILYGETDLACITVTWLDELRSPGFFVQGA